MKSFNCLSALRESRVGLLQGSRRCIGAAALYLTGQLRGSDRCQQVQASRSQLHVRSAKGFGAGSAAKTRPATKQVVSRDKQLLNLISDSERLEHSELCPCSSGRTYADCCQPYLTGAAVAATPEALMRSRYSAYVKNRPQYVVDTTHPDNPRAGGTLNADGSQSSTLLQDAAATCRTHAFSRLRILEAPAPDPGSSEALVAFEAWYRVVGQVGQRTGREAKLQRLEERSRFLKGLDGRWLYHSGQVTIDGENIEF